MTTVDALMNEPYYQDDSVALHHGDALDVLRSLEDGSVGCCVTSPPYFGLRDYGQTGQYGLESSPADYAENMRHVFAEVRRVLADDGTLWLNLGDSYSAKRPYKVDQTKVQASGKRQPTDDRPAKNLLGIPWRVAFALQDDGWILRNDIIWSKPNAMPESVNDRLSGRYEHVFLFSKSPHYYFDLDAVKEPARSPLEAQAKAEVSVRANHVYGEIAGRKIGASSFKTAHEFVNPGDVWTIPTSSFNEAHFAVMAPALASRCVKAGCKPGGTVLDPFSGAGTTGMVAGQLGRRYVGIDLSAEYLDLSLRTRLGQSSLIGEDTEKDATTSHRSGRLRHD